MVTAAPITETLIQNAIAKAVQNVFRTMLRRDVTSSPNPAAHASFDMLASVGFVGTANGVVYLCLSNALARFATGEMLGLSPGDAEMNDPEVVKDAIGEITNMTVGGFKNQLCDVGFPCKLTLPVIVRGNDLEVVGVKDATRYVFEFHCAGLTLTADIQLKSG